MMFDALYKMVADLPLKVIAPAFILYQVGASLAIILDNRGDD